MLLCPSLFWGLFVPFGLDFGGYFLEIVRNHLFSKIALLCQLACMKLGGFVILGKIYPCYSRGAGIIDAKASFLSCRLETLQAERMCFRLYTSSRIDSYTEREA
jgi:hypothetical protein